MALSATVLSVLFVSFYYCEKQEQFDHFLGFFIAGKNIYDGNKWWFTKYSGKFPLTLEPWSISSSVYILSSTVTLQPLMQLYTTEAFVQST